MSVQLLDENLRLREEYQDLLFQEERAKSVVAEHIYHSQVEQQFLIQKILALKEQIAQLTSELSTYKKKEDDDSGTLQLDESGEIKAGSVEKLTEALYSQKENNDYQIKFLLTYRSFTSTREVLDHLIVAYTRFANSANTPNDPDKIYRLKIGKFLKKWIDDFRDFAEDKEALDRYFNFIHQVMSIYDSTLSNSLKQTLDLRSKGLTRKTSQAIFSTPAPSPIVAKSLTPGSFTFVDIAPIEIARQLTLIDYNLCRAIESKEFLGLAWTKKDKEKRSPNLLKMINHFNDISRWSAWLVVSEPNIKKRSKILSHLVSILQYLRELNNFNAMFMIVGGLGNSAVHRLHKTFDEIKSDKLKLLEDMKVLCDPLKSWANYRNTIHGINPPCVPFMGVYQTDLTFIEDGNPDKFSNGLINFKKCRMIASVIEEIQQYQLKPYNLTPVPQIQEFISKSIEEGKASGLEDKQLFDLSLVAEPRQQ
mmetsp:Transcript_18262/g.25578  ORF Transcript_18262/g.25578 Transcript_18262/m.25578 type:complete len:478 (+) Transcript_18262:38-1471(+)